MDPAPPKRGGRRPKAPDLEPSGIDVEVVIDGPEDAVQAPETASRVERSSGRVIEVRSAANLEMMESLVGGALPVADAGVPGSTRSIIAPVLFSSVPPPLSDASPSSVQPLSDRELLFEADKLDTTPPVSRRKLSFFDVGDDPGPRARLFDAAPAPFDPHVPSLPGRAGSDPKLDPDSGLLDIRSLVARDADPKKKKKAENRADDDIFNLTGGLFAAGAPGPIVAPDLNALIAPVLPEAGRSRESARPSAASGASSKASERPGAPTPAGSSPRRSPAATASQKSTRAAWAVGITVLGAGLLFLGFQLGKPSETTTPVTRPGSEAPPPSALETASTAPPVVTPPPPVEPLPVTTPTIAAREPGAPVKHDKDPVVATPTTATPRPTAPTAPVVAPPVVTAPVVVAPPPPPAGGAEFDRAAAVAALNAAAGRAAGCKQPDDPSGGATVSVTFAPSGRVTSSKVTTPPFQGTPTGGCIASAFHAAKVPPFEGAPVSVTKNVSIR